MADALKAEGNKAFSAKDYSLAAQKFSEAIALDPNNHLLYSNRSSVYGALKEYQKALDDAEKTVEIKPDWAKGWSRKGAALHGVGKLEASCEAYEQALKLEPSNAQAKSGLDSVKRSLEGDEAGPNPFNDPQLVQKLAANPKTSSFLADPAFMAKLQQLRQNPNAMGEALQDPRFLQVMSVLLGIDMQFGAPPTQETPKETSSPKPAEKKPEPQPQPEPEPEDEENMAKKKAKEAGDKEKQIGTENYKKRQFDAAIEHYSKAWELNKDVTYLNNVGAAKFEKGDYQGAIDVCQEAVTEGREMLADFKIIAKSFGRIGTAYEKLGDLGNAIEFYQKSLTEHRTPDILSKLRNAEKLKVKAEKEAYVNPEEAVKAREVGNEKFKNGDYPAAVDAFTEWTKRAPEDPKALSNRAAALVKLMALPQAVSDCDAAIALDRNFIRAYLRKAQALFTMKEYTRCMDTCAEALEHDISGANTREIESQQQKALEAQFSARAGETEEQTAERIQRDPEIMSVLQDPVMQSILQQAKENPAALQEHMKNPQVRNKVQKLIAAGVIRTR